ncbi:S10 family peptidase [Maribacter cobaltidurans]|uniref:Peptidase S10 n=1 Tax=Maribacter cobaltidurans TaxID=1178778 RepID=A0A223V4M2_9FLAO|nr:peptidase S10 [Maribacter cobaltidurans]ASV30246.1 peptidase S10 [Maribacter cobaltidurans]GGD76988.1 carboxypeptidase [Maribacter cobaltidurans]
MKKLALFTLLFTSSLFVLSQTDNKEEIAKPIPKAKTFETMHQGVFGGKTINYKATAKETFLTNEAGDSIATFWSVAYTKNPMGDVKTRPVTFVFNGGPGSASVWLHMGLFGPKIIKVDSEAKKDDGAAPYNLVANEHGLLDLTDLVFIDPVGTGYSQLVGKGKGKDFYGLKEDVASFAQFIRKWVTDNGRWFSPKYLAGESYGTTRAAYLGNALEGSGQNMALNGMILISQALDYAGSTSIHYNITSYITYLPSMAATAWYHKKAGQGKTLTDFVKECREFTYGDYTKALYKGNLLDNAERNDIAEKLSYFTGLDKDYILKSNLRILVERFQKKLLENQGLAIGRLDGRFMGDESDDVAERPHLGDPASYQIGAAYTAGINHYFATDLKVDMDRPYITSGGGEGWRWRTVPDGQYWEPMPVNTAPFLGETMRRNPEMKVMVANGYYDLITPFFDAEYTFARNGIVTEKVSMKYYEAGHMMYTHEPDLIQLSEDIRVFYNN